MRILSISAVLCLALSWTHIAAQNSVPSKGIEISFTFNRQSGFATNQFAVWVEDSGGGFVKTLFATRYTASGGWKVRPQSIPGWVKKSGLSSLGKNQVDAFSGATPRTGTVSCRWDGTGTDGKPAPAGEYRVFLEATLRSDNRALYSAPFTLGSRGNFPAPELKAEYSGGSTAERDMIENVTAAYIR